jgi:hypothetical protein
VRGRLDDLVGRHGSPWLAVVSRLLHKPNDDRQRHATMTLVAFRS